MASLLGLWFLIGGLFGSFGLQPVRFMADGLTATATLVNELSQGRPTFLQPMRYSGNGVVAHDPSRASAGLTLVQGYLPGGPQVRLVDMAGREIHRWDVDMFAAWQDPDHIAPKENVPKSELHYHSQGFLVRPDGSLLVNIARVGAVNMDKCGNVLWTVDRMVHHSILPGADGGYWFPSKRPIGKADVEFLPPEMSRKQVAEAVSGTWNNVVETVLKVDERGRPERELTLLEALRDAGLEAAIHDGRANELTDPTHLNDIERVTPALASKIEETEPGDLLVSVRNMNMLAILDREDGSLLWHERGPWVRQHDPDITSDGVIEIFNNRSVLSARRVETSEIMAYDPGTDRTILLHPKGPEDSFYTQFMGSHQRLPNGNRLIVESYRGRIFEVTPEGEVVWSYVLPYDETHTALIEHAERVPLDFFDVEEWTCDSVHG